MPLRSPYGLGRGHELLFQCAEVDGIVGGGQLGLQVHSLLGEVEPGEGIGVVQLLVDGCEPPLHRLLRALTPTLRPMSLERFEITPHRSTLLTSLGQRRLVAVGHRSPGSFRFGCHLSHCGAFGERISTSVSGLFASPGQSIALRPWSDPSAPPTAHPLATPLHRALGPHRRRSGPHRGDPRPVAQRARAGHVRGDVVGALLLQVVPGPPRSAAVRGAVGDGRAGRERRRGRLRRRRWRSPSASRATTTRPPSSPTRGRPRASAASSATSSPWAPAPSPCSTRSTSGPSTTPAAGGWRRAWSAASPATATRSACPPSAASCTSPTASPTTPWSTSWPSASCATSTWSWPGPKGSATRPCSSGPPPGGTASAG